MKERPILMSGDNPKLILEGRKTQTRRIVKPQPDGESVMHINYGKSEWRCPYGVAGDRLWVRETHAWVDYLIDGFVREDSVCVAYRCGGEILRHEDKPSIRLTDKSINLAHSSVRWRPSIHMPRWASRITLEILKVRVERLQDISEADAQAEGVIPRWRNGIPIVHDGTGAVCIEAYRELWDSLHGKGAWEKNPWVWVIEFRKI